MVTFPFLGTLARRFGSQRLLYASGLGIIPLSALWILSDSLAYLLAVQILGGMMWAGYELATFLLLFERIEESERTSVLTLFNLANAVALVGGALIGGLILKALGQGQESYYVVFGLSGLIRVASILFLVRLRRVSFTPASLSTRTLGVRPNTGSLAAPITTSLAGDEERESRESPVAAGTDTQ
jgi:MFS family permease